jgi:hypothetical protein
MSSSIPQPLKLPLAPGASSPSQSAIITNQNMYNKQATLNAAVKGGRKRRHRKYTKRGGSATSTVPATIAVNTTRTPYTQTMASSQAPESQQLNLAYSINQHAVQSAKDNVALVIKGGKKSRKSRRKSRKNQKSRKGRKSRRR